MTRTSRAAQDYLKALFILEDELGTAVSTTAVSQRIGVSAASATNMLKRLEGMGLIDHAPYKGALLTDGGRKVALEVIRHHRLLETYLAEALGVPWDEVHAEAEVLEHVLSEDLEDRIAAMLGHPSTDPHGHPIPAKDGSMPKPSQRRLTDMGEGESAEVDRVADDESEALRYLGDLGIRPGVPISVTKRGPKGALVFVLVGEGVEAQPLARELAEAVWVA